MNFYQQPFSMPYPQGVYQQPVYPQFVYADQLVNPNESGSLGMNQQSYIENILRLNLGKNVSVYMNFENSQWGSKIFKGRLEAAGKDHIIISDLQTGTRYLLLSIYLDYITFDEEINYYYPYQQQTAR